ncbi:Maf family protein [Pseudoalteromonas luteoviolacea]|uniref:dTTP/UTP pyrophosphatase n=1 Tax=Pseudoalteromonas luteoviolacea S4054 TaxID=1129367 RepID=A0A0F6AE31_9GAMM|nr:Maf family protein [Pseudoalteromonas luteoviolacea]AOT09805.1 septum formation protein Maf [Pseudoalteromonas luteoviolacea]AOT14717.1 septum formation protein Maf [Pseudoalteromonas luteoviolacea]AOT19632.1 septum formation protein Maf [Pseudoalteromonas luteoviolacea]KKE84076.1 Maf [Pseudoalteromonas luteoviolacea S4054]KZN77470.1 Maf [Pseudoalteromonas luteoviolacea S4047-1]
MAVKLYLASASPRRKELLSQLGYVFEQFAVDADESALPNEEPHALVERLARLKAQTGISIGHEDRPVLGSDTIVVAEGKALGKPVNKADFISMMTRLSGKTHQVMTAIALANSEKVVSQTVVTDVTFKALSDDEIEQYWLSGEPQDKAGGYGIQGLGGRFVTQLKGSYFAVVGLPLYETDELIQAFMAGRDE